MSYQDYLVFVAPNPQQKPKYLAIIRPVTPLVWLIIFASLAFATIGFVFVSSAEEKESIISSFLIHCINWIVKILSENFYWKCNFMNPHVCLLVFLVGRPVGWMDVWLFPYKSEKLYCHAPIGALVNLLIDFLDCWITIECLVLRKTIYVENYVTLFYVCRMSDKDTVPWCMGPWSK